MERSERNIVLHGIMISSSRIRIHRRRFPLHVTLHEGAETAGMEMENGDLEIWKSGIGVSDTMRESVEGRAEPIIVEYVYDVFRSWKASNQSNDAKITTCCSDIMKIIHFKRVSKSKIIFLT